MRQLGALVGLLACVAAVTPQYNEVREPRISSEVYAAGDSVRYTLRFTVPASIDSVRLVWSLGTNPSQVHTLKPPFAIPASDVARFAAPPLSPGGSSFTGSAVIQTFHFGIPSAGVTVTFDAKRLPPAPPPDIGAIAFVDSAVAFP